VHFKKSTLKIFQAQLMQVVAIEINKTLIPLKNQSPRPRTKNRNAHKNNGDVEAFPNSGVHAKEWKNK
jgi:hypothetical protein